MGTFCSQSQKPEEQPADHHEVFQSRLSTPKSIQEPQGYQKKCLQNQNKFLQLIQTSQQMMRNEFLQFFQPNEILKLCLLSKKSRFLFDPNHIQIHLNQRLQVIEIQDQEYNETLPQSIKQTSFNRIISKHLAYYFLFRQQISKGKISIHEYKINQAQEQIFTSLDDKAFFLQVKDFKLLSKILLIEPNKFQKGKIQFVRLNPCLEYVEIIAASSFDNGLSYAQLLLSQNNIKLPLIQQKVDEQLEIQDIMFDPNNTLYKIFVYIKQRPSDSFLQYNEVQIQFSKSSLIFEKDYNNLSLFDTDQNNQLIKINLKKRFQEIQQNLIPQNNEVKFIKLFLGYVDIKSYYQNNDKNQLFNIKIIQANKYFDAVSIQKNNKQKIPPKFEIIDKEERIVNLQNIFFNPLCQIILNLSKAKNRVIESEDSQETKNNSEGKMTHTQDEFNQSFIDIASSKNEKQYDLQTEKSQVQEIQLDQNFEFKQIQFKTNKIGLKSQIVQNNDLKKETIIGQTVNETSEVQPFKSIEKNADENWLNEQNQTQKSKFELNIVSEEKIFIEDESSSLEFIEKETPQSQNMYSSLDYPDKMHQSSVKLIFDQQINSDIQYYQQKGNNYFGESEIECFNQNEFSQSKDRIEIDDNAQSDEDYSPSRKVEFPTDKIEFFKSMMPEQSGLINDLFSSLPKSNQSDEDDDYDFQLELKEKFSNKKSTIQSSWEKDYQDNNDKQLFSDNNIQEIRLNFLNNKDESFLLQQNNNGKSIVLFQENERNFQENYENNNYQQMNQNNRESLILQQEIIMNDQSITNNFDKGLTETHNIQISTENIFDIDKNFTIRLEISDDLYMTFEQDTEIIKLTKQTDQPQVWKYNSIQKTIMALPRQKDQTNDQLFLKFDSTTDNFLQIRQIDESNIQAFQFDIKNFSIVHIQSGMVAEIDFIWVDNYYHRVKFCQQDISNKNLDSQQWFFQNN